MRPIEEDVLTGRDRTRRSWQIGGAVDHRAAFSADLVDHAVQLVVNEGLERLLGQVDPGATGILGNVLGDVKRWVKKRTIVGVVRRPKRNPVRDYSGAYHHQQQRCDEEYKQPRADTGSW